MDDRSFDSFTRALATAASRRTGIRLLAGASAALVACARRSGASAQDDTAVVGPGEPCRDSSQCAAAEQPLICADNGFDHDGPLNCCAEVGGRCGSDETCCGGASCLDGFCSNALLYAGPGEPCTDNSQCRGADTPLTCDYVWSTADIRCCAELGSRCGTDAACCGAANCVEGTCTAKPLSAGDLCQNDTQCTAEAGLICGYNMTLNESHCCFQEGGRCSWVGDCCGSLQCGETGFCGGA